MPPKKRFRRGDVVLAIYPESSLRTAKPRPALIIQANNLGAGLAQVIVPMITSNMARANHPSRVSVLSQTAEGQKSGLLANSVVMTDNLATIAFSEIDRAIGELPMTNIDVALRHTLGL